MTDIQHFISGAAWSAPGTRYGELRDPNTGAARGRVCLASAADVDRAVASAVAAQHDWAEVNPQRRARVMFEFKRVLEARAREVTELLSAEHGKTIADAKGELQRAIDLIEFACGIPHLLKGEHTDGAGPGIDVYSIRQPLGVVAGITPFNFPLMTSVWMFGIAIPCGNAVIMKPSEKVPGIISRIAELFIEAGGAPGLLNVVHGDKEAVDAILVHPSIKAVSFIGSSDVAQYIYAQGAAHGKRVQAMGGAKNHGVVLRDADLDLVATEIMGAAYGSAGMRCMSLPVVVPVGNDVAERLRTRLVERVASVRVGTSSDESAQYGPITARAHYDRVREYIDMGVKEGAELVVDGRLGNAGAASGGHLLGPSLFDHVTAEMRSYREEIFGPVLQIVRASTVDEALSLATRHQYGNGVAIFTRDGHVARRFARAVETGMVGINVALPVPVSYHSFGGWKRSAYGGFNQHGIEGIRFYTRIKTITTRWPEHNEAAEADANFSIPIMQ